VSCMSKSVVSRLENTLLRLKEGGGGLTTSVNEAAVLLLRRRRPFISSNLAPGGGVDGAAVGAVAELVAAAGL